MGNSQPYLWFFPVYLYLFVILTITAMCAELTLDPKNAETYLGGTINFTCHKNNPSMAIAWEGPFATSTQFMTNNQSTTELNGTIFDISFNNSIVRCLGQNQSNLVYYSNTATILLQGTLSKVDAIIVLDTCIIHVHWDPPFTLEGVPILGYNVNVTNLDTNITVSKFTQDANYNITVGHDYRISIAGVNGAGEGNKTIQNITFSEQQRTTIHNTIISRNNTEWIIDVTIENKYICLEYPGIFVGICKQTDTSECFTIYNFTQVKVVDNKSKLSTISPLPENVHYYLKVTSTNGRHNVSSNRKIISTFDVQAVDIVNTINYVCLTAYYAKGSLATGAFININCSDSLMSFTVSGPYGDRNEQAQCGDKLPFNGTRNCILGAYDQVNDLIQSETGPALTINVMLHGNDMEPPSDSHTSMTYIIVGSFFGIGIMVVILIVCIQVIQIIILKMRHRRQGRVPLINLEKDE